MRLLTVFTILILTTASVFADPVDYSLPDLKGKMHSLAEYKGKWVIVNYWATWCPPCQEEIPDLVDFHDRHKRWCSASTSKTLAMSNCGPLWIRF